MSIHEQIERLAELIISCPPLFVLTGAGCSTASGIPDYRDQKGNWKHSRPVLFQDFAGSVDIRRRYWARSLVGWPSFSEARPNPAHRALADMEKSGLIHQLVTQNVDGLHQQAGSRKVIDLHGNLEFVVCMDCGQKSKRVHFQERLHGLNPAFQASISLPAPDGDAQLDPELTKSFSIPACLNCNGRLKPEVVFFGENVPRPRVQRALTRLEESGTLLVLGSSLMVFSGYRFCRAAQKKQIPIVAVNLGKTRADDHLTLKLRADCSTVLDVLSRHLTQRISSH
ncbi:MAG: NAD-dependent protein deacetylase [Gammaproteobacteria bacterium]|nr:NAD-dependent protein deacetylase [Gammaproteobacteria bacterium]